MSPVFLLFLPFIAGRYDQNYAYNEPIPKEPHWWKVIWMRNRVQELRVVLPARLYRLISTDPELPFVLKESLQAALAACKQSNVEKNEKLTCTHQSGQPYGELFKTVTSFDSRDFSFLLSLTTAFAVRAIAEACAEGRLKQCTCDKKYMGSINGRPRGFYWSECVDGNGSHNLPYALKLSRKLMDRQFACVVPLRLRNVILHNISVGRMRVSASVMCRCESPLYCEEKRCQLRVIDESILLRRVIESLWNSRRMRRSNGVEMRVGECDRRNRDKKYRKRRNSLWYVDDGTNAVSFFLGVPH
ncbi:hypothetical protein PMAYCL1PPCAC_21584 [Pristionchus mayeri]|uniref:Protein Wnt n=1 Tax=Pristionchus mayeri TaxID=1317129 RepID=A0AAN5I4M7_9BILA|nr:hypothetical protein PMAYCL1PPCAC_21584 [Pristionchus mayeri]